MIISHASILAKGSIFVEEERLKKLAKDLASSKKKLSSFFKKDVKTSEVSSFVEEETLKLAKVLASSKKKRKKLATGLASSKKKR